MKIQIVFLSIRKQIGVESQMEKKPFVEWLNLNDEVLVFVFVLRKTFQTKWEKNLFKQNGERKRM